MDWPADTRSTGSAKQAAENIPLSVSQRCRWSRTTLMTATVERERVRCPALRITRACGAETTSLARPRRPVHHVLRHADRARENALANARDELASILDL